MKTEVFVGQYKAARGQLAEMGGSQSAEINWLKDPVLEGQSHASQGFLRLEKIS